MNPAEIAALHGAVRPVIREWRRAKGLAEDPLQAFRASGYLDRITRERAGRAVAASSYA